MHLNGGRGSIVVLDNLELPEHGFQIGLNHSSPTAPHIPSYPPKSLWLLETRIPRLVLRRSLRGFPRSDRPGRTPSVLDRGYAGTSENACSTSLVNKGKKRGRLQWAGPTLEAPVGCRWTCVIRTKRKGPPARLLRQVLVRESCSRTKAQWLCSNRAATRVNLLKCREIRQRGNSVICRYSAISRNLQQTILLPSHGRGRWF